MRRLFAAAFAVVALAGITGAHAVSDGQYDPARNHCSGNADNSDHPAAEAGCYTAIMTVSDYSGHEYLGAGIRQTADGDFANTLDIWVDPGAGDKTTFTFDSDGPHEPSTSAGSAAHPESGLRLYFGGDDNLDVGEHDSSNHVNNGPSDGGGIQVNIDPANAPAWVAALSTLDVAHLLTNPLPVFNAGTGACADGICFAVTSQQRVAIQGAAHTSRDIANYTGKEWDPESCDGPDDSAAACADADHPGFTLGDWFDLEGVVHTEPGFQFFEDPDPQASPAGGPYPLPALYIGPCGAIFGGGIMPLPDGPGINPAHQFEVDTAC